MIKRVKIYNIKATFVLRHRWEADKSLVNYTVWEMRKRYKVGIWFEKSQVVGPIKKGKNTKETVKDTFKNDNLVNNYMIGLDLIVCKTWVTLQFKPTLDLK
jgi:hypothetical protein